MCVIGSANMAKSNLMRAQRSCHDEADIDANHLIFRYSNMQVLTGGKMVTVFFIND